MVFGVYKYVYDNGCYQYHKLDGHLQKAADNDGYGHHHAGEIYFSKDACVGYKGIGSAGEAGGKITPDSDASQLK